MEKFRKIGIIIIAVLVTSVTLFKFSLLLPLPQSGFIRELLIASGQMMFQALFLLDKKSYQRLNYFQNLMTVSLIGSILLLPNLLINYFSIMSVTFNLIWFFVVVFIMFLDHIRRVKSIGMPKFLTLTWILYRVLVLIIIHI